jgi:hypothetical protein
VNERDWSYPSREQPLAGNFTSTYSVKSLYLSQVNMQRIAPALQETIGERVVGVLPALKPLFLEDINPLGLVKEAIGSFVSGRQLSSHPVVVSHWDRKRPD